MTALSTDPPAKYRSVINLSQQERAPVNEICDTRRGKVLNGEHVIKGMLYTHFCVTALCCCSIVACLYTQRWSELTVALYGALPYFTSIILFHAS